MAFAGEETRELAARVLSLGAVIPAICCAVPEALSFGLISSCFAAALVAAYYFAIVRHVGDSREGFPGAQAATDSIDQIRESGRLGAAVALAACIPLAVHVLISGGGFGNLREAPATLVIIVLVPQLYLPAAVIAAAVTGSGFAAMWPPAWLRVVSASPSDYGVLVLQFLVTGLGWGALVLASDSAIGKIPILSALVLGAARNLLLFSQACLAGSYVRRNVDVLQ